MPPENETPVTATGLAKYVPLFASAAVALAVSAFGWGVAWSSFQGRVDVIDERVLKLEAERDRMTRIERLLARLVCRSAPADDLCLEAMNGIGGQR